MSRQKMELVTCDRCKRQEPQPISDSVRKEPEFACQWGAEKLAFQDLCFRCKVTVQNYFEGLKEWERDVKPLFKTVDAIRAPPLQAAPDYTPPKPHSPAAARK